MKSANHFQTIFKRVVFLVFVGILNAAIPSVLITRLSWKPDTVQGGG